MLGIDNWILFTLIYTKKRQSCKFNLVTHYTKIHFWTFLIGIFLTTHTMQISPSHLFTANLTSLRPKILPSRIYDDKNFFLSRLKIISKSFSSQQFHFLKKKLMLKTIIYTLCVYSILTTTLLKIQQALTLAQFLGPENSV